ncbi:MAG: ABC transporter substrate-binding protein [Nitrospirota bacterium]
MSDDYRKIKAAILMITVLCFACEDASLSEERGKRAKKATGDITIAVAGSWDMSKSRPDQKNRADLRDGVELAVEEVNKTNVLKGRKIHLIAREDSADLNKARLLATEVVYNTDITAVIGHTFGFITSSVADIYKLGGMILMSPGQFIPEQTKGEQQMAFSYTPQPDAIAELFVRHMQKMKYKSVAITYVNSPFTLKLLNSFYNAAEGKIKITDSVSFNINTVVSHQGTLRKWANLEFDAIVFIAPSFYLGSLLKELKDHNMKIPVMTVAEPGLLVSSNHKLSDEVFVITCNYDKMSDELKQFISEFNKKYNYEPGHLAVNAYEAVKVLTNAWAAAGTTEPEKAAQEISKMKGHNGLCGTYNFNESGMLNTNEMYLVKVKDGKIEPIIDDDRR